MITAVVSQNKQSNNCYDRDRKDEIFLWSLISRANWSRHIMEVSTGDDNLLSDPIDILQTMAEERLDDDWKLIKPQDETTHDISRNQAVEEIDTVDERPENGTNLQLRSVTEDSTRTPEHENSMVQIVPASRR